MHAIAHGGCTDTEGESAPKVDSGRKIPCRTGESTLSQRRAGPTIYQFSYILAPFCISLVYNRPEALRGELVKPYSQILLLKNGTSKHKWSTRD